MELIKTTRYHSPVGEMVIGSFGNNICLCDWICQQKNHYIDPRICRHLNAPYQEDSSEIIQLTIAQLREYFNGIRQQFSIPIIFTGSHFQRTVWEQLTKIPYGSTISYSELARRIGNPHAIRAVANATAANPISILIPCHRVIRSNHTLSGYRGGFQAKQFLLSLEASSSSSPSLFSQ